MSRLLSSLWMLLCLWFVSVPSALAVDAGTDSEPQLTAQTQDALKNLASKKLSHVGQGIAALIDGRDSLAQPLFEALLDSKLYRVKKSGQLVYLQEKQGKDYLVVDIFDPQASQTFSKRKMKRVGINNKYRRQIKAYLASLNLSDPDEAVRIAAIRKLLPGLDSDSVGLIRNQLKQETSTDVIALGETALAIHQLHEGSETEKLAAIKSLSGNLEPQVKIELVKVKNRSDESLQTAALASLDKIAEKSRFYELLETVFFGLSLGSVLVLAAIGLAITFGVMGCINMAHGELIMIGAYTTYVIQQLMPNSIGASLFVAIPAAFVVSGLVGILIERGVIQFLKGRPLETLLATFGVSLVLQQTVRSIFSPLNRSVSTPDWMSGSLEINPVFSLTLNRLYIILFCLMVFALLFMILRRTRLGLQVRAVSQNRGMARAMGVRSEWVDAMTFGLGSGIAGVAGVALSQLTNVGPNLGQAYIVDSFMVVVFGGVGNLWGTLVAGMSLGVANKVLEPVSGAVLAKILVLIFIILFIQKRPRGLFPQKGRAAEA